MANTSRGPRPPYLQKNCHYLDRVGELFLGAGRSLQWLGPGLIPRLARGLEFYWPLNAEDFGLVRENFDAAVHSRRIPCLNPSLQREEHIFATLNLEFPIVLGFLVRRCIQRLGHRLLNRAGADSIVWAEDDSLWQRGYRCGLTAE